MTISTHFEGRIPVIFEDHELLVVDKPAGIALLRDRQSSECLWTTLRERFGKLFLVHRLDKGTSGVLAIAKTQALQSRLTKAFEQRQVAKHYLAWVMGSVPAGNTYLADLPLCKGRKSRYRVAGARAQIRQLGLRYEVTQDRIGVDAITRFRALETRDGQTLLAAKPVTGRTHQLRVHLAWLNWPICGDHLYNPTSRGGPPADLKLRCVKLVLPSGVFRARPRENFSP